MRQIAADAETSNRTDPLVGSRSSHCGRQFVVAGERFIAITKQKTFTGTAGLGAYIA